MKLYSTNDASRQLVSFKEAVMKGLPDDNGLFMPNQFPHLPETFFDNIYSLSFNEIAFRVLDPWINEDIPSSDLERILDKAFTFPAPVVELDDYLFVLELFHGPSLAFKDFGARFMAEVMSYFNRGEEDELVILVATSGDTGGAVANGFLNVPGIRVVILYPSGKVSPVQEKQLTTLGGNITALEVNGTFDDCQSLVKQAFLDKELCSRIRLTSANSINIARLLPQSLYYFDAFRQLPVTDLPYSFCVPSGNFGNLTAGLFAKKIGLPVGRFIAATNVNDIVPKYLETGIFTPKVSVRTISNAMDVGNPSNFSRMLDLYGSTWNMVKDDIAGYAYDDFSTETGIKEVYDKHKYVIDPHGAVGYLAAKDYQSVFHNNNAGVVVLETAHFGKFKADVSRVLGFEPELPMALTSLMNKEKNAITLENNYNSFVSALNAQL